MTLKNIGRKYVGGTVWMGASQFIIYIFSFGTNIVLARLLVPDDFGVFALGVSLISFLYILGSWSFSILIIQAESVEQSFFDTAYWLSFGIGVILFVFVGFFFYLLRDHYPNIVLNVFIVLAAIKIPALLSSCYNSVLQREMDYKKVSFGQTGARITSFGVAIILAGFNFGVWSLVGKEIFSVIITFLVMRKFSSYKFRLGFDFSAAKYLLKFGSRMLFARGLESFITSFQNFIVGTVLGTVSLGYFDQAIKFSQLGSVLAAPSVDQVSLGAYSRLQSSKDKLSRAFEIINSFLLRIFSLISVLLLLFGEELTVFLYGEQWRTAGKVVPYLSLYVITIPIFGNIKSLLYSQAKMKDVVKVRIVQAICLVIGMAAFLNIYGLRGAALIITSIYIIGTIFAFIYIKGYVGVDIDKRIFSPLLAGIATIIINLIIVFGIGDPDFSQKLLFGSVLSSFVYLGFLWILERKRLENDLTFLLSVVRG